MAIVARFLSNNRTYITINPQFAVLHETANPGATAKGHYGYCNTPGNKFAHFYVDDVDILQFVPVKERAPHVGNANNKSFGLEMCRPKSYDPIYFAKVWNNSVECLAEIFVILGWTAVTTDNLKSHDDCRREFGGTTHTDPIAYLAEYGKTMDDFRKDLQKAIDRRLGKEVAKMDTPSEWAKEACEKAIAEGLIKGDGNGHYGWQEPITLERLLVILYKKG